MKEYRSYEFASIQMADDERLKSELRKIASLNEVDYIIESGAFLGLGSTSMLAEAFKDSSRLKKLFTIEINYNYFKKAQINLSKYPFVECCYGCSLDIDKAIDFINADDAINNHENYPNIYIDTLVNPRDFYSKELNGLLHSSLLKSLYKKIFYRKKLETNLLSNLVSKHENFTFLIVLDSAGGTGFMEYQTINNILSEKKYYLMLDDIHHLKHFRSYEDVKKDSSFNILAEDYSNGWMLAVHVPK